MRNIILIAALLFITSSARAIVGGLPADSKRFNSVRLLTILTKHGAGSCTGTLIQTGMILTAAHCVIDENEESAKGIFIRVNGETRDGYIAWGAAVDPLYKHFDQGHKVFGHDIAIVYFIGGEDETDVARTPMDYLWEKYKEAHSDAWYPEFLSIFSIADWRQVLDDSIDRNAAHGTNAYIVGFGLTLPGPKQMSQTAEPREIYRKVFACLR